MVEAGSPISIMTSTEGVPARRGRSAASSTIRQVMESNRPDSASSRSSSCSYATMSRGSGYEHRANPEEDERPILITRCGKGFQHD